MLFHEEMELKFCGCHTSEYDLLALRESCDSVMLIHRTGLVINSDSPMVGLVLHGNAVGVHVSGSLKLKM